GKVTTEWNWGEAVITVTTADGGYTASCTVTVVPPTTLNNPTPLFSIYPNPFTNYLIVHIPTTQPINIYNLSGQCVYKSTLYAGTNKIDTSHLPNGFYVVKCGDESLKMVK
ncbi:MAG: T9SS type A sorting domain-containing protein, partial [Dysgonamonadaceae bacterium]|nr:T9SS type A sorting domain-containing protein [Dysgonamonadaceae bacterium]